MLALEEGDAQAGTLRGFIDLNRKEQVFKHGQDFLGFQHRLRLFSKKRAAGKSNITMQALGSPVHDVTGACPGSELR
jgi:hypothetical protein